MTTTQPKSSAREMETQLFTSPLNATVAHLVKSVETEFQLDAAKLAELSKTFLAGLNYEDLVEETHKKKKRGRRTKSGKPRQKKQISPECRCMARVWGSGSGTDQCSFSKKNGLDYCTKHAKLAAICCEPCKVDANGKKMGLFCGRIDQFQDGEDGVPPYKDATGIIRIEWTSDEMKTRVEEELGNGVEMHLQGGRSSKKKKKGRKKKSTTKSPSTVEIQSAQDLADALEEAETKTQPLSSALDDGDEDSTEAEFKAADTNGDGVIDAQEFAKMKAQQKEAGGDAQELMDQMDAIDNTKPTTADDVYGAETEEEELEVEERDWEGTSYYVDPNSNKMYNPETGEVIGNWSNETGPKLD